MVSVESVRGGAPSKPQPKDGRAKRSDEWSKRPILVHVGYPKSGSTYLQRELFRNDSAVWYPLDREGAADIFVHMDGLDFNADSARRHIEHLIDWSRATQRVLVISHEGLMAATGSYGVRTREIGDRLWDTFGEQARILIVVREQRALILSHFAQYRKHGGTLGLRRFLAQDAIPDRTAPVFRFNLYEYDRAVSYYRRRFGDHRVLILALEQLKFEPQSFFTAIYDLLDVGLDRREIPDSSTKHNVTVLSPVQLVMRRWSTKFSRPRSQRPDTRYIKPILRGMVALEKVTGAILPESLNRSVRRRWAAEIDRTTGTRYAASNRRLATMTGLPLERLGYVVQKGD